MRLYQAYTMLNNYRGCCVYQNPSRRISSRAQMSAALLCRQLCAVVLERIRSRVIYCWTYQREIMIGNDMCVYTPTAIAEQPTCLSLLYSTREALV